MHTCEATMGRYLKKNDILVGSPQETMGFSKDFDFSQVSLFQNFLIKKFNLSSIDQIVDIKQQLMRRKILIVNAREILENKQIPIEILKNTIDDLKAFLKQSGGSIGRLGEHYLILTPNSNVKMGF
ncbi:MAG: cell division protein SepF [Promethearchaeota archaeon]